MARNPFADIGEALSGSGRKAKRSGKRIKRDRGSKGTRKIGRAISGSGDEAKRAGERIGPKRSDAEKIGKALARAGRASEKAAEGKSTKRGRKEARKDEQRRERRGEKRKERKTKRLKQRLDEDRKRERALASLDRAVGADFGPFRALAFKGSEEKLEDVELTKRTRRLKGRQKTTQAVGETLEATGAVTQEAAEEDQPLEDLGKAAKQSATKLALKHGDRPTRLRLKGKRVKRRVRELEHELGIRDVSQPKNLRAKGHTPRSVKRAERKAGMKGHTLSSAIKAKRKGGSDGSPVSEGLETAVSGFLPAGIDTAVATGVEALASSDTPQIVGKTVTSAPEIASASVMGIYMLATEPEKALKAMGQDYYERYKPLLEGDPDELRKVLRREGLLPYALDAAAAIVPVGTVGGAVARTGALGSRAKSLMSYQRPKLQVSRNVALPQRRLDNNLIRRLGAKAQDTRRIKAHQKRARRAAEGGKPMRAVDVNPNVRAGRTVVPRSKRLQDRKAVREEARQSSFSRVAHQIERAQKTQNRLKKINRLGDKEKLALRYAYELGIRADVNPIPFLRKRAEDIRVAGGGTSKGRVANNLREVEELMANPEAFTPEVRAIADDIRDVVRAEASSDPGLRGVNTEVRRVRAQGELLGINRHDFPDTPEGAERFVATVDIARKETALDEPGYLPHERTFTESFSDKVRGRGIPAMAGSQRTGWKLYPAGRTTSDPGQLIKAIEKPIKRRENWAYASDFLERHADPDLKTFGAIKRALEEGNVDWQDVAIVDKGRLRTDRALKETLEDADSADTVQRVFDNLEIDPNHLLAEPQAYAKTDLRLVDRALYEEMSTNGAPGWMLSPTGERLVKYPLRVILGLSPEWVLTELLGNAPFAAMAGAHFGTGLKAVRLRHRNPEIAAAQKLAVRDTPTQSITRVRNYGSKGGRLVRVWEGFKSSPGVRRQVGKTRWANPTEWGLAPGKWVDNAYREGVLLQYLKTKNYSQKKWVKRMGPLQEKTARAIAAIDNTIPLLRLTPDEQLVRLMKDPKTMERASRFVDEVVGDFTTFTKRERATLQAYTPFYGWLRFSLRWALYTMPTKHPIITNIGANLGRLGADEIRDLLDLDDEDRVPFGAMAAIHLADDIHIPLWRIHPALNQVSELDDTNQLVGLLPPVAVEAFNQIAQKNLFLNKDWLTEGQTTRRDDTTYGVEEHLRIAANNLLSMAYPYRKALRYRAGGTPQGADTLLWDLRPTEYKDPEITRSIGETEREQQSLSLFEFLGRGFPGYPQPSKFEEIGESLKQRREAEERERSGSSSSSSPSSGDRWGGSWSGGSSSSDSPSSGGRWGGEW